MVDSEHAFPSCIDCGDVPMLSPNRTYDARCAICDRAYRYGPTAARQERLQPCGHPTSCIVHANEGTAYCQRCEPAPDCEWCPGVIRQIEAVTAENEHLREALTRIATEGRVRDGAWVLADIAVEALSGDIATSPPTTPNVAISQPGETPMTEPHFQAWLVVTHIPYEGSLVEGVFSTEQAASAHADKIRPTWDGIGEVDVECWKDGQIR